MSSLRPFLLGLSAVCAVATCNTDPQIMGSPVGATGGASGQTGGGDGKGDGGSGTGGSGSSSTGGTGGIYYPPVPDGGFGGMGGAPPMQLPGEDTCGYMKFELERVPPELLLVFDRSSSMTAAVPGSMNNRWVETVNGMDTVLMATSKSVSWGLKMFPTTMGCDVAAGVEEEIAGDNYMAMSGTLKAAMPAPYVGAGGTPTGAALKAAVAYFNSRMTKNPKYIVLATDGEPTCPGGTPGAPAIMEAMAAVQEAVAAGYKVFVVGIATQGTGQDDTLNMMAVAGGEPRATMPTRYFPVANGNDLVNVFDQITVRVSDCVFPLDKKPPAPESVAVDIGMTRLPRDKMEMNGWNYGPDMMSIVIHGETCEMLKAGAVTNVQITFGCIGVPVP